MQYAGSSKVRISPNARATYIYSVKVANRERKSDYTVEKLNFMSKFSSVEELRDELKSTLQFLPSEFGFVEPGHGLRGKQRWIHDDADIEEMYNGFPRRRDFLFWCYTVAVAKDAGRKRPAPVETGLLAPKPKSSCQKKIVEVEEIIADLKDRHGGKFSTEQFTMWAHVIHIGKHSSYDIPPDQPFFKGSQKKASMSTPISSNVSASSSLTASPGKRVSLRSECINQLDKWHSLLEKGIVSQEQYDQMQKTILSDMFKF